MTIGGVVLIFPLSIPLPCFHLKHIFFVMSRGSLSFFERDELLCDLPTFLWNYMVQTCDPCPFFSCPVSMQLLLRFGRPLDSFWGSPRPPSCVWKAACACFFLSKLSLQALTGASFRCDSFLLFIATKDFAFISYIFLVSPFVPPRLSLLSFS